MKYRIEFVNVKTGRKQTIYYESWTAWGKAHKWYNARPKQYRDVVAYDENGKPANADLDVEITEWINS
jgi:hypothetical protein